MREIKNKKILSLFLSIMLLLSGLTFGTFSAIADSDFSITVAPEQTSYYPGDTITYTVTYTNTSNKDYNDCNIFPSIDSSIGTISGLDVSRKEKIAKKGGSITRTYTLKLSDTISQAGVKQITFTVGEWDDKKNTLKTQYASTTENITIAMPQGVYQKEATVDETVTNVADGVLGAKFTIKNGEGTSQNYTSELLVYKNGNLLDVSEYAVNWTTPLTGTVSANGTEEGNVTVTLDSLPSVGDKFAVKLKTTDKNSNISEKSVEFERKASKITIVPEYQGPYLAGSTVNFTVKYVPESDIKDAKYIKLIPAVDDSKIASASNLSAYTSAEGDVKAGTEYSYTYHIQIPEDYDGTSLIHFSAKAQSGTKKGVYSDITGAEDECGFKVIPLEGVQVIAAEDAGSNIGTKVLKADFDLKNYNKNDTDYEYELIVQSKGVALKTSQYTVNWSTPLPDTDSSDSKMTMASKGNETATVKIDITDATLKAPYKIILKVTDVNTGTVTSKDVTIEPGAISAILPKGLNLDLLYYGNVARDADVPFSNADELRDLLSNSSLDAAKAIWEKYRYDLYDPNCFKDVACTQTGGKSKTYGYGKGITYPNFSDDLLSYAKDESNTPFHDVINDTVKPLSVALEDGLKINYGKDDYFTKLEKSAGPNDGDANTDREYDIELKTTTNPTAEVPRVYVLQIQTSWQMFDYLHASATKKTHPANKTTGMSNGMAVGSCANVTQMANLYDIKQALIRFAEYMKEHNDGSVLLAITNVQHTTTFSMVGGSYLTNDMDSVIKGLYSWDTFGDCEHVHYSSNALNTAISNVPGILRTWKDAAGNSVGNSADTYSIVIGGATENTSGTDGYGISLPAKTSVGNLNHVYGIRTVEGTNWDGTKNSKGDDIISWLDIDANQSLFSKAGNGFYVAASEDAVYNALLDIYNQDTPTATTVGNKAKVQNVTLTDTVKAEFDIEDIEVGYLNGNTFKSLDDTDYKIKQEKDKDGNVKVTVTYNEVVGVKTLDVRIHTKAKDDYLGSNNVYTNVNTNSVNPEISSYEHYNTATLKTEVYDDGIKFKEKPQVNVPISFNITDGLTVNKTPGESVNLSDIAYQDQACTEKMTKEVEDLIDNYPQTNGTLTYQWYDSKGNAVGNPAEYTVTNGVVSGTLDIPDYTVQVSDSDVNKTLSYTLKATFTPRDIELNNKNDVAVTQGEDTGIVQIKVSNKTTALYLSKQNNKGELLKGAEFAIYTADDNFNQKGDTPIVSGTSNEDGLVELTNLIAGKYLLYETKAAEGYQALSSPMRLTIDDNCNITLTDSHNVAVDTVKVTVSGKDVTAYKIINFKIYSLPNAGRMGVFPIIILGVCLVSIGLFVRHKKIC